jgi:hypothetical protein
MHCPTTNQYTSPTNGTNVYDPYNWTDQCSNFGCVALFTPNVLSFLGSCFVFLAGFKIPELRKVAIYQQLQHISVWTMICSIFPFYYFHSIYHNNVGLFIGVMLQYGVFVTCFWVMLVAFGMLRAIERFWSTEINQSLLPNGSKPSVNSSISLLITYCLPIIILLPAIFIIQLSDNLTNPELYTIYTVIFNGPLFFSIFMTAFLYYKTVRFIKTKTQCTWNSYKHVMIFPFIWILCWVPSALVQLTLASGSYCKAGDAAEMMPTWLQVCVMISNVLARSQGIFNVLAYSMIPTIWVHIKQNFKIFGTTEDEAYAERQASKLSETILR